MAVDPTSSLGEHSANHVERIIMKPFQIERIVSYLKGDKMPKKRSTNIREDLLETLCEGYKLGKTELSGRLVRHGTGFTFGSQEWQDEAVCVVHYTNWLYNTIDDVFRIRSVKVEPVKFFTIFTLYAKSGLYKHRTKFHTKREAKDFAEGKIDRGEWNACGFVIAEGQVEVYKKTKKVVYSYEKE